MLLLLGSGIGWLRALLRRHVNVWIADRTVLVQLPEQTVEHRIWAALATTMVVAFAVMMTMRLLMRRLRLCRLLALLERPLHGPLRGHDGGGGRGRNSDHDVLPVAHLPLARHAQVVVEALGAFVTEPDDDLIATVADYVLVHVLRRGIGIRSSCRWSCLLLLDAHSLGRRLRINGGLWLPVDSVDLDTNHVLEEFLTLQEHGQIVVVDDAELSSGFVCGGDKEGLLISGGD